jgi:MFS transporter, DHA2 family, glioxin efflux transporter
MRPQFEALLSIADISHSFYINLPIGAASLGLILLSFKPPASAKPVPAPLREIILQLDIPGAVTILAALVCFLLVTEWAGVTRAWSSGPVVVCLVLFGVLTLAFIAIQIRQAERASLVPRILKLRTLAGVCLFAFL